MEALDLMLEIVTVIGSIALTLTALCCIGMMCAWSMKKVHDAFLG